MTTRPGGIAMVSAGTADSRAVDSVLYIDGVEVSFDGFKALNNLSFYVNSGELRAVIGPNGAGKTTMMDVVTGAPHKPPRCGCIRVCRTNRHPAVERRGIRALCQSPLRSPG